MTSWGRPYIVLYVTSRDVPYRRLKDDPCRHPEDVLLRRSNDVLHGSIKTPRNVQEMRASVFGLSINECYITKIVSTAQQVDNTKGGLWITYLKLSNKTYIVLSSKFLSNSILSFINLTHFFYQDCVFLQQNWLYTLREKIIVINNENKTM